MASAAVSAPLAAQSSHCAEPPSEPPLKRHCESLQALGEHSYKTSKDVAAFRDYSATTTGVDVPTVERHYKLMRINQTFGFAKRMAEKYHGLSHSKMTINEGFDVLKGYVDCSDPDTELPNLEHMLQASEGMRKDGCPEWMQLVGLIHDMGKMMFLWAGKEDGQEGTATGDQWALGGDTWVAGCKIPDSCVYPNFNTLNPDMHDERYRTEQGVYRDMRGAKDEPVGMNALTFAYGHDEYMFHVVKGNSERLLREGAIEEAIPEAGLAMLRFHSCYPWHTQNEYSWAMTESDHEMKKWVVRFNKYDLYTKSDEKPDAKALWPYYQGLIDKFLPGKLHW